jgi:mitogen-activated protein kinase kinase 3
MRVTRPLTGVYLSPQIVHALHYLQSELKVIHRDVKPVNILINRKGQVKMICEFGISSHLVDSVWKPLDRADNRYMAVC